MAAAYITDALRDATILALTSHTDWNITPKTVDRFPHRADELSSMLPAVFMLPGPGGRGDREALGSEGPSTGSAVQQFVMVLLLEDDASVDGLESMDKMLDDVRNALERSADDGNPLCAIASDSIVTSWTETQAGIGIAQGTFIREVTVDLSYDYRRGGA